VLQAPPRGSQVDAGCISLNRIYLRCFCTSHQLVCVAHAASRRCYIAPASWRSLALVGTLFCPRHHSDTSTGIARCRRATFADSSQADFDQHSNRQDHSGHQLHVLRAGSQNEPLTVRWNNILHTLTTACNICNSFLGAVLLTIHMATQAPPSTTRRLTIRFTKQGELTYFCLLLVCSPWCTVGRGLRGGIPGLQPQFSYL
jgi:hypothetical protein